MLKSLKFFVLLLLLLNIGSRSLFAQLNQYARITDLEAMVLEQGTHLATATKAKIELETQVIIAQRLGFLTEAVHVELTTNICEIARILCGLLKSLSSLLS